MIHGMDTGFLVAVEHTEHAEHAVARQVLAGLRSAGDQFALVAEFMHVVTDARRFARPISMKTANQLMHQWWTAAEVIPIFPDNLAMLQFLAWVRQFSLGRKRLLDTLLAATFRHAGIQSVLTTNPADFGVFGVFSCVTPAGAVP